MSVFEHPSRTAHPRSASHTPRVGLAQRLRRAIRRWQTNRAIKALSRLDERLLEDIGISRNDIPRVVAGLFPPEEAPTNRREPEATPEDQCGGPSDSR